MAQRRGLVARLRAMGKIAVQTRPHEIPDLVRLLLRTPEVLLALSTFETALLAGNRVDARLKALAALKASSLIGCPF